MGAGYISFNRDLAGALYITQILKLPLKGLNKMEDMPELVRVKNDRIPLSLPPISALGHNFKVPIYAYDALGSIGSGEGGRKNRATRLRLLGDALLDFCQLIPWYTVCCRLR